MMERILELEQENVRLREQVTRLQKERNLYKENLEQLVRRAELDFLTGLYNRNSVHRKIEDCLKREPDGNFALCFLDLDNFKQVNDRYGHSYGDEVLRDIAGAIRKSVSETDMAGRFGGDEFLVFMREINDREDILRRAESVCGRIREGGLAAGLTASMGIACYPEDGRLFQELLDKADTALYRCKCMGKDRIQFTAKE